MMFDCTDATHLAIEKTQGVSYLVKARGMCGDVLVGQFICTETLKRSNNWTAEGAFNDDYYILELCYADLTLINLPEISVLEEI